MRRTLSFRGAPGTLALKVLGVTTPLLAAAITGGAIVLSYLLLSLAFRCISVAFAVWEALGLVLVTLLGVTLLGEQLGGLLLGAWRRAADGHNIKQL